MKRHILCIGAACLLWASLAYADGMFVSDMHRHLEEPMQKAVVAWDGQKETMILSAAARSSDIANFAWIVPIVSRTPPIVSKSDISLFRELVSLFMRDSGAYGLKMILKKPEGVEVIETQEIDIYDIAVLKATNVRDLMEWLNLNGYKIPPLAEASLEQYIVPKKPKRQGFNGLPPLKSYFVANKVDLKNQHRTEIAEVRRIYAQHKKHYDRLCARINKILSAFGVREEVGQAGYTTHQSFETLGVLENAVHDPANPFNLPRKWSASLGQGIRVEEICSAEPYFRDGRISFRRSEGHKWAMAVYRNGDFVSVLDYAPYTKKSQRPGRHLSPSQFKKEVTLSQFEHREAHLLKEYIENRQDYHAVITKGTNCDAELKALARSLNQALGTSLWDLHQQSRELFPSPWTMHSPREFPQGEVPLSSQILAVSKYLGTKEQRQQVAPLSKVLNDLQSGLATPLKFEFQPLKPTYPLRISSLNRGFSSIEVYVISNRPVIDHNKMLTVDQSKAVPEALQKSLAEEGVIDKAGYVTRLYYQGLLSHLKADAVFQKSLRLLKQGDPTSQTENKELRKIKARVASDKETPAVVLAELAGDKSTFVRFLVAGNPGASPEILNRLASDDSRGVRQNVANNPNAPADVLIRLAEDPFEEVQWRLAMNPSCPASVLELLAARGGSKMKLTIVNHPNLPLQVLKELTEDDDPHVAHTARLAFEDRRAESIEHSTDQP